MAKCIPPTPLEKYRRYMEGTGAFSRHTVSNYLYDVQHLERYLRRRRRSLLAATHKDLQSYAESLKQTLRPASRARRISGLRHFFEYAKRRGWIEQDPSKYLWRPRVQLQKRPVPSEQQVLDLIEAPRGSTLMGLRDRAMFELLYGGGLRVEELSRLDAEHVDARQRLLLVMGKGEKERLCPINANALRALERYHAARRQALLRKGRDANPAPLLTTGTGRRLSADALQHRVVAHAKAQGLAVTSHTLRHAYATHLLERGVRLEDVKLLLGHSDVRTTQRYTHPSTAWVLRQHKGAHPRARSSSECRQAQCGPAALRARVSQRALTTPGQCAAQGWRPDTQRRRPGKAPRFSERNALPARMSS